MSQNDFNLGPSPNYDTMNTDSEYLNQIYPFDSFADSQIQGQCWAPEELIGPFLNSSEIQMETAPLSEDLPDLTSGESSRSSTLFTNQSNDSLDGGVTHPHGSNREAGSTRAITWVQANGHLSAVDTLNQNPAASYSDFGECDAPSPSTARLKCPLGCELVSFGRTTEQTRHLEEQHECGHEDCKGIRFHTRMERVEHEKSHNGNELGHRCGSCPQANSPHPFRRPEKIKNHFNAVHKTPRGFAFDRFKCFDPACSPGMHGGLFFASDSDLQSHIKFRHSHGSEELKRNEVDNSSLNPLQKTNQDKAISSDHKKHLLDCDTEAVAKRSKGDRLALSCQDVQLKDFRLNITKARQMPSLTSHEPRVWEHDATLIESIGLLSICSLLRHPDLRIVNEDLGKLNVSVVLNRPKGAINLRGALSVDALNTAKALLEPLLYFLKPRAEISAPKFHPKSSINRKLQPKQQRKDAASSIEVLAIDPVEDKEAIITWEKFIAPDLSEILQKAGVQDSYTVTLVRQQDTRNGPAPVIRFQSSPQAPVTWKIIRKRIKEICWLNHRPELPIYFYNGSMVTLDGSSSPFSDDPPNTQEIPHQILWYPRPGMGTSIGMSQCEHNFATLGGYIHVGDEPFVLTVSHVIEDAHTCKDCGIKTPNNSVDSPAPHDVIEGRIVLDRKLQSYNLVIENSEAKLSEDEVDLSKLIRILPSDELDQFSLIGLCERWRDDLNKKREDFKLGDVVKSSGKDAFVAPSCGREGRVEVHRMDWAIIRVDPARLGKNKPGYPEGVEPESQHVEDEARSLDGIGELCEHSREFVPGEEVYYTGSNSNRREGKINRMPLIHSDQQGKVTQEWFMLLSDPDDIRKDDVQGDSGAWIIAKNDGYLLGLVWAFECPKKIIFTPITEVFQQISLKMDGADVQVAPPDQARPQPTLTPLSGRKRRSCTRITPRNREQHRKRALSEERCAKPKQYIAIDGKASFPIETAAFPRSSTHDRSMALSLSPAPSFTFSGTFLSEVPPPDPPRPDVRSSCLDSVAGNFAGAFQKLGIVAQPFLFQTAPSLSWKNHPQLLGQYLEVAV